MKFSTLSLSVLFSLSLLSGCVHVGKNDISPKVDMPQQWHTIAGVNQQIPDVVMHDWQHDDQVLEKLKQMLKNNNYDLKIAALNYMKSRVQRRMSESDNEPQVGLSGSISRQRLSEDGATTRIIGISSTGEQRDALVQALTSPYNSFLVGFDASWEPDLWGKVANSVLAAEARETLSANEYKNIHLLLESELMRLYFELRTQQYIQQTLTHILTNLEAQKDLIDTLYHEGLIPKSQSITLAQQLILIENQIVASKAQTYQLANQLSLLVGKQPGELETILFNSDNLTLTILSSLPLALPSEVLRNRPDVQAAEAQLRASTAMIGIAEADLYPRFTLTGNVGIETLSSSELSDWASRTWSIGPRFYLPIFNRNQLKRRVELTKLEQQQAAVQYQQKVLSAWSEVDNAINQVNASLTQLSNKNQQLELQKEQLNLASSEVETGLSDKLQWYNQQHQVFQMQLNVAQATLNYNLSQLSLYKSIGGFNQHLPTT